VACRKPVHACLPSPRFANIGLYSVIPFHSQWDQLLFRPVLGHYRHCAYRHILGVSILLFVASSCQPAHVILIGPQPLSASPILASLSGITILLILAFCQPEHVILLRLLPFILGISLGQSLIVDCGTLPTRALLFCSVLCHYPVRHSRHLFPGKQQSIDCGILANRCIKSCLVFCN
jgi:hypothetical protein